MAKFHLKLVPRFFNAKRTIKKGAAAKTVRKFAPENDFCTESGTFILSLL